MTTPKKKPKPPTPLKAHENGLCGCSLFANPNSCIYQPFLDGWDFTPDVGNGQVRGEVFTPRFIVDMMLTEGGLLPKKMVYDLDYSGSREYHRKYLKATVFEPAVGTGNFISTVLWHKLEIANHLTLPKATSTTSASTGAPPGANTHLPARTPLQLIKYQTGTLEALSSIFFNDIDAGNLQATKWRLLRTSEINTEENIDFWVDQTLENLMTTTVEAADEAALRKMAKKMVEKSIKIASENWGTFDEDKGVLDVLYKKHTGQSPPAWLREAWTRVLDTNAKLYNVISSTDTVTDDEVIPGSNCIEWTFRKYGAISSKLTMLEQKVPQTLQSLASKLREVEYKASTMRTTSEEDNSVLSIFESEPTFSDPEAGKQYVGLQKEIANLKGQIQQLPQGTREIILWERDDED